MGLTKYSLGELLELTTEINSDLKYSAKDVKGMTITKEIIPTKADLTGTNLEKFLVVHPKEFVFNPRTHGAKIGFGYNNTSESFIISWNNIAFRIKPEIQNIVLPEYLFLHFNRSEWDREACYRSWGSSTEVFSWDALCEMKLELPSLQVQKKYVDVYNSMLENQRNYERGLEDLKLTIDIQIDKLKSNAKKFAISDLLEEIDNRNTDGKVADIQGINITKQFMKSVADTTNVNLSRYKIVEKNQFAYSGMQTGRDECIRISLYTEEKPIIISPAYSVLQVKTENILPEYIMMWFSRKEIDRMGWFMSDSSIRSNLDMDRFFEMKVPVPNMVIQKSLVSLYKVYVIRRGINEKLKTQIKDICPILIKGSLEEKNDRL